MVNIAVAFTAATLALATGSAAQISIACTGASGCGTFWISQGTTTNSELRDLVLQTVGVRPSATQADNMVFICTDNRLAYDRLCATGDCITLGGLGGCRSGSIPFP